MAAFKDAFLKALDEQPLPDIGSTAPVDRRISWLANLSDAEVNTIAFAVAFAKHALASARMKRILAHYGPHLVTVAGKIAKL